MRQSSLIRMDLRQHLVVALKDFDGIPALLLFRQMMHRGFLDMRKSVLHGT